MKTAISIPDRYGVFRKEYPNLSFCRVTLQEKGLYQVISSKGAHQARVSGKFQYEGDKRMLLADNVEDRALLREMAEAIYEELPAPKKKNQVGGVCKSGESGNAQSCHETIRRRYWLCG